MNIGAILITLISGLAFFIGFLITLFVKDEKKSLLEHLDVDG